MINSLFKSLESFFESDVLPTPIFPSITIFLNNCNFDKTGNNSSLSHFNISLDFNLFKSLAIVSLHFGCILLFAISNRGYKTKFLRCILG